MDTDGEAFIKDQGLELRIHNAERRIALRQAERSSQGADSKVLKTLDTAAIERAFRRILASVGEDPDRDGLRETPRRAMRAFVDLLSGLRRNPIECLGQVLLQESNELVVYRNIEFSSLGEHDLLPFFGHVHVAFQPRGGRVLPQDRVAHAIDVLARRPQLQERLTQEIADTLYNVLNPVGVCVVVKAEHLCEQLMRSRQPKAFTTTRALTGLFVDNDGAGAKILDILSALEA